jgi:hypothetical protein
MIARAARNYNLLVRGVQYPEIRICDGKKHPGRVKHDKEAAHPFKLTMPVTTQA